MIYLILWLAVCLLEIAKVLKLDASLKWMLWQSKVKSGIYITIKRKKERKKKEHCQGLLYTITFALGFQHLNLGGTHSDHNDK